MTTTTFSSMVEDVAPHAPGCPTPMVVDALRRAAIRTCERTLLWRHVQPKFQLQAGVHEYSFDRPVGADVHAVLGATLNGMPFETAMLEDALARYPAWADLYSGESAETLWSLTSPTPLNQTVLNNEPLNGGSTFVLPPEVIADAGEPRLLTQVDLDKFIVLPLPDDGDYTVRMFYALKPSRTATSLPTAIADELRDLLVHGALKHLLVMQGTNWQDMPGAGFHAKQYTSLLTEARARANLTAFRGVLVATSPTFA